MVAHPTRINITIVNTSSNNFLAIIRNRDISSHHFEAIMASIAAGTSNNLLLTEDFLDLALKTSHRLNVAEADTSIIYSGQHPIPNGVVHKDRIFKAAIRIRYIPLLPYRIKPREILSNQQ
jgi:hypothetical protein